MLPLNWRLTSRELAAVVEDSQTPLVFVDREFVQLLEQVRARTGQASGRSCSTRPHASARPCTSGLATFRSRTELAH